MTRKWTPLARLSAVLSVAILAPACGSSGEPDLERKHEAIAGGSVDRVHTNVFAFVTLGEGGTELCSASLIAPNLLLTAQHCVAQTSTEVVRCDSTRFGPPTPAESVLVALDTRLTSRTRWYGVSELRLPPGNGELCGYDIALAILANNFPAAMATPLVPRIDVSARAAEVYAAVGYGLDLDSGSGTRRNRTGLLVSCSGTACGPIVTNSEWGGQEAVCPGDSGGPALDAAERVIGVASRGSEGCRTPIYSSVSSFGEWIRDTARDAARLGGYTAPSWVETGLTSDVQPDAGAPEPDAGQPDETAPPPDDIDPLPLPATPEAPVGGECGADADCAPGLVCHRSVLGDSGVCAKPCSSNRDCEEGWTCSQDLSLCVLGEEEPPASSGCSVQSPGSRETAPLGLLAGLLLLMCGRSRRTRLPERERRG
jgi:hypothetical protein